MQYLAKRYIVNLFTDLTDSSAWDVEAIIVSKQKKINKYIGSDFMSKKASILRSVTMLNYIIITFTLKNSLVYFLIIKRRQMMSSFCNSN